MFLPTGVTVVIAALARALGRSLISVVLVLSAAITSAVWFSVSEREEFRATSSLRLSEREPGGDIRHQLNTALIDVARRRGVDLSRIRVTVRASSGDPRVQVVVRSTSRADLIYNANRFASELVAWDRGPAQERVHDDYFDTIERLDHTFGSQRAPLLRRLARLRTQVVTDSYYSSARGVERALGPAPVRDGLVALLGGAALASVTALALAALQGTTTRRRSDEVQPESRGTVPPAPPVV